MISLLKIYITSGVKHHYKDETNRRIMVVNLFSAVGVIITFFLGIRALIGLEFPLAAILLTASAVFALSQRIQIQFGTRRSRTVSITLLITCLMVLMFLLLITGGKDNTGPLWIYLVPPVTMFFAGFTRGLLALLLFTIACTLLFFVFDESLLIAPYTYAFKSRLLYSFLTVTFLSAFYEYSRQKSYDIALDLSEQFEQQANHDHLTKLVNRRGAQTALEREYARVQRGDKRFSIAIADIDRFKSINDTYGHEAGDDVLRKVSLIFSERLRKQDILARWGGEEFMFIFPETTAAEATQVLEELREILSFSPIAIEDSEIHITSSFGVCEVTSAVSLADGIRRADISLYRAKESGRNRVTVFTAS
ncbi:GGDEF domain-containing protein [Alteromonas sp. BMJM2]|uniref:GGDEF domain-containing protein n=1 Tax=Alteromonas sp. BMJM2 TaxID=2954241 RepID=UPI0022B2EEB3|nr:GGDEF domain-containing protein [Alteromonas sp. BMJM2]